MAWKNFIFTDEEANSFLNIFNSIIKNDCIEYEKTYIQLGEDKQGQLGYFFSIILAEQGPNSAYDTYCLDCLLGKSYIKIPFKFLGWAGENKDLGPVYEINTLCLGDIKTDLFYTDDDIQNDSQEANELAQLILNNSSGLTDFRVIKIKYISCISNGDNIEESKWGIVFNLDKSKIKNKIIVNGNIFNKENSERYIFVLPKTGEFECMFGEIFNLDTFIPLAYHRFCMK